jgi:hypothetical protein
VLLVEATAVPVIKVVAVEQLVSGHTTSGTTDGSIAGGDGSSSSSSGGGSAVASIRLDITIDTPAHSGLATAKYVCTMLSVHDDCVY